MALRQHLVAYEAMREQLEHLLEISEQPHVHIHIIPHGTGWHPGLEGAFSLLDFSAASSIVHLESRCFGLFLGNDDDVQAYQEASDSVWKVAISPTESSRLLADVLQRTG